MILYWRSADLATSRVGEISVCRPALGRPRHRTDVRHAIIAFAHTGRAVEVRSTVCCFAEMRTLRSATDSVGLRETPSCC